MPIEQVVTVSLPRSGSGSLPRSGSADLWDALTAAGRGLTGATRVVVLREQGAESADEEPVDEVSVDGVPGDPFDEPPAAATDWLSRPDVITIASVSGRVAGAWLDAVLACDLRIVADDAQLSSSHSVSGIALLGELMGYSRALEFVVSGVAISGELAATVGLANMSVAPQMLEATVAELVATVLRTPREVAMVAKAVLGEAAVGPRRLTDELAAGIALAANES